MFKYNLLLTFAAAFLSYVECHHGPHGYFWIFNSSGVTILDCYSKTLNGSISSPSSRWGDIVYLRDQAQIKHYIFANDYAGGKVNVYDADTRTLLTQVKLGAGAKPQNLAALSYRDEVWSHDDSTGNFNVFRMSQVRSRVRETEQNVAESPPGFGKFLTNVNFQDVAFATNENAPAIFKYDIFEQKLDKVWQLTGSTVALAYNCSSGTRGIEYSPVSNHIYVQCNNAPGCNAVNGFNDTDLCNGGILAVDADTGIVQDSLNSTSLSIRNGVSKFGVQGEPVRSPDNNFIFVSNTNLNTLHIIRPRANAKAQVMDIPLSRPGALMKFYTKSSTGNVNDPSNYWAVIPVSTGVVFIDMANVVSQFAKSDYTLPSSMIGPTIAFATGGITPTIEFGFKYIIAATKNGANTGLIVIDTSTKSIYWTLPNIASRATRFQWVPIEMDEIDITIGAMSDSVYSILNTHTQSLTSFNTILVDQNETILEVAYRVMDHDNSISSANHKGKITRDVAIAAMVVGGVAFLMSGAALVVSLMILMKPVPHNLLSP
eukprot:gene6659-13478_t